MTTILGHNISIIRPRNIAPFGVRRCDRPVIKYPNLCQPKINKENSGKVKKVCLKLRDGTIKSLKTPATHADIILKKIKNVDDVVASGWQLENGKFIWR